MVFFSPTLVMNHDSTIMKESISACFGPSSFLNQVKSSFSAQPKSFKAFLEKKALLRIFLRQFRAFDFEKIL